MNLLLITPTALDTLLYYILIFDIITQITSHHKPDQYASVNQVGRVPRADRYVIQHLASDIIGEKPMVVRGQH